MWERIFPELTEHPQLVRVGDLREGNSFMNMPVHYSSTLGEDRLVCAWKILPGHLWEGGRHRRWHVYDRRTRHSRRLPRGIHPPWHSGLFGCLSSGGSAASVEWGGMGQLLSKVSHKIPPLLFCHLANTISREHSKAFSHPSNQFPRSS